MNSFGDYIKIPVRSAAILTNSYVGALVYDDGLGATKVKDCSRYNQLVVLADFTIGSLTDAQIKIEFSPDNTNFYQETFSAISTITDTLSLGIHKMTGTGKFRISLPIKDRYIKISVIGTGTVTSSSITVDVVLGVN